MKRSSLILSVFLLLFMGRFNTTSAQQSADKVIRKVTIVNYEGKPQPDIYAFLKGDDERKFFRSDANGILTFIVDTTEVDEWIPVLIIDHERSLGYRNVNVCLREDTVIYDTKEDVQQLLKEGKPLQNYHCEEMPEYPGGIRKCIDYLMMEAVRIMKERNISLRDAVGCGMPGKTIVRIVVDREGNVTSPVVVRRVDPVLDEIALEAVLSMPKWKPATVEGKPVPCTYFVWVSYRLQ